MKSCAGADEASAAHKKFGSPEYKFITEFENERNNHIVDNILKIVKENPNKKILVAIGIDHKYYIEKELEKHNVKVYQIDNIELF